MKGPASTERFQLGQKPELVWVTGYEAVMVGEDGKSAKPQEFMCHSNLDIDVQKHRKLLTVEPGVSGRLFTLSQGQFTINFPEGFGVPMLSTESFSLTTQVLNLNEIKAPEKVRHKVTLKYVKDSEAKGKMVPLFQKSVYGLQLLEGKDGFYNVSSEKEKHGPGCLEGQNASSHTYPDSQGRKFTGHWVVKPGREVNRTLVTKLLSLPYDTKVHYIAVHLHPFAETLELVDLTAKKTVFKSKAKNYRRKIGLQHVDYYSSKEGIMLHKDHAYELVSIYNNTTDEDQDSMAVMYLYMLDKRFKRPSASDLAKVGK